MKIPQFDLSRQYEHLSTELEVAVLEVLRSGRYILGKVVENFENEFADYCGTKYAIGVASGTDALIIALRCAQIGKGDEVIVPSFTFFATAEAVANIGATPVFADVDIQNMCIMADEIEKKITPRTKCIIPVHLFGHSAPMDEILSLAQKHGFWVIEDAAQAVGAKFGERKAGSMGHLGAFSFYPTKNLGCMGDGGAITTNSEEFATMARKLRNHGSLQRYDNEMLGYNSRLDAIQAAVLSVKLRWLDEFNEKRREIAERYRMNLHDLDEIVLPAEGEAVFHVYHQFTVRVPESRRNALIEHLNAKGIGSTVYYPKPLHMLAPFAKDARNDSLKNSEILSKQVLSLPMFPELLDSEIDAVSSAIRDFFING